MHGNRDIKNRIVKKALFICNSSCYILFFRTYIERPIAVSVIILQSGDIRTCIIIKQSSPLIRIKFFTAGLENC